MNEVEQASNGMPDAKGANGPRTGHRRGELQDRVQNALRHGLMSGAFVPGQVLSLRKIADRLGTSPMPVREALSQLLAINVLETKENRSVQVPRLDEQRIEELIAVRVANEGMAARLACQRQAPGLVDELTSINEKLVAAIAARDLQGCLRHNKSFHFTLYGAAQSSILMPLIEALWLQCGPTMYLTLLAPDVPWDAAAHFDVLDAMRRRDCDLVEKAIVNDIRRSSSHLATGNTLYNIDGALPLQPLEQA